MSSNTESWGSRVGLILAMAGNAVGLGNFLRFPVQAIQNGGGSFIIPYLVCFFLLGLPLLYVEWAMGRFGGKSRNHSSPFILDSMSKYGFWKYVGVFGIFTNLVVAAYYCYLESWTLGYIWHSVAGTFTDQTRDEVASFFSSYTNLNNNQPIIFWIVCLILNTWILSRGIKGGVEKVAKIGMPLLILFGIILAIKGLTLREGSGNALYSGIEGLNFLWTPDFSSIWSGKVWLAAAGQIFFTLSLGNGSIQCYASYLKSNEDIALNAMSAGWMNEFVEVCLGGAIIIPITVGYYGVDGMLDLVNQAGGLGLGFRTLPFLFQQWGPFLAIAAGVMWFGLLFFAGITSSLAMGTSCMGFLQDEFGWRREYAALAFGVTVALLGLPTVYYFNYGVFDEYDHWAGTVSLVVFAFFEIILFAWFFGMQNGWAEITRGADIKVPEAFKFIIQYVTPVILACILYNSMPGNWARILNTDLHAQIAEATDATVIATLEKTILYRNISRIGLLLIWLSVSALVYVAYRKRVREGRFSH
jgi:neurotransmitter:Na+ symporter, NSS family